MEKAYKGTITLELDVIYNKVSMISVLIYIMEVIS